MKRLFFTFIFFLPFVAFGQQTPLPLSGELLGQRVSARMSTLTRGIQFVVSDSDDNERKAKIKDLDSMFIPDATIQEKSCNKLVISPSALEYLNKLYRRETKWDINIYFESVEIPNAADFSLNSNGTWSATAIYVQIYERKTKEGRLVYKDRTKKTVEIVLKKKPIYIDGNQQAYWEVMLGNITVAEVGCN